MTGRTEPIDLRSDTVTRPTEAMRRAMYEAEVADDTYDGDPTVIRLQELAAEKTGKEAALFVVSGTMGNLLGVLVNTYPGQEVILGDESHQFLWEVGGIARIAGCVTHTVPFHRGWLDPMEVEAAIRPAAREAATTGLICVEDTSNVGGGAVIPPEHLAKISDVAKRHNLPIHLDGARLFNAVVASGRPAEEFTQYVDTLSFCLSKGLGAPFGALLCANKELIERAISFRQMLGGGMRQAGVMAAAGIVALETGVDRLAEDHANAKKLALGLAERFPGCCDPDIVETNLFHINVAAFGMSGQELADYLAKEGILVFPGELRMRLATHCMITSEDIDEVLKAFDRLRAER
ncbi:MAG TPA: aminotransferase class I/II-fold pyridoxal phosphate-dependent enzyme [Anaerolineae bacterium]|nr:aminotransferase class I/II-fold pyridoxal phosphate-dependent enzyme [Anaerolineae bacterium]HIQ05730.1 aminotransferase class I/II-fold pyridoxal phosphate-dependent enzyme [Anaerolineae bacterium]